ncbi:CDP-diacylglycerol--inositol 3-phosphatidyltransferase [Phycisphaerae bacterium RAS1]|nr:CDP-diacylglycerol--inositol 3-phosphatidyltransferase [Phycisphaerae bacterium RAS1]
MPDAPKSKDFRRFRESGQRPGFSKAIGQAICDARDQVARFLIARGATPNRVTIAGFLITCAAAGCMYFGASHQAPYWSNGRGPLSLWPAYAAILLFAAGALDMLDGAVARVGDLKTRFGGILDSCIDRFSDMAIFLACAAHFALRGHVTLAGLAVIAMCNALLISYIKARAETVIPDCSVGYWLRGERFAAVLIGASFGHLPAVMWQLAIVGGLTVVRRMVFSFVFVTAQDAGRPLPPAGPFPGVGRLLLWRYPRGSVPYDVVTGLNIAYIIFAPLLWPALADVSPATDLVRRRW